MEGKVAYLSMITGSEGVSFLFPQLFLSQHRLETNREHAFQIKTMWLILQNTAQITRSKTNGLPFGLRRTDMIFPVHVMYYFTDPEG